MGTTTFAVKKCDQVTASTDRTTAAVTTQAPGLVGLSPTLTIGIDGMPMVVYNSCGNTGSQLSPVHCGTATCMRTNRVR